MGTCVGWQVTLCDPIWQVTSRSCEMGVLLTAIHCFSLYLFTTPLHYAVAKMLFTSDVLLHACIMATIWLTYSTIASKTIEVKFVLL